MPLLATFPPFLFVSLRLSLISHGIDFRFEASPELVRQALFLTFFPSFGVAQGFGDAAIHLMFDSITRQTNGTFDRQGIGAAMGNDRHAVQTDQRRAAILGIIQS